MKTILVINSGSSSLKYQLITLTAGGTGTRLAHGLIERIGDPGANIRHKAGELGYQAARLIPDHASAFAVMVEAFAATDMPIETLGLTAVGHRVVQGGSQFIEPTVITDEVVRQIAHLSPLAPLHNPGHLAAIKAARQLFQVPHVAVFDTAFHQTMPPAAYTYALNKQIAQTHQIRRYGFHGTSHQYVSRAAAEFLGKDLKQLQQIVLHLGNGASACAISGGKSINTSMGLTPLAGLVMGSRSGDVDPSILFYLARVAEMNIDELDQLLNKKSGLLGLTGSGDMRDVVARAATQDPDAQLALAVYVQRARQYVGAYATDLGRLDVLTFTAGVGENNAQVRAEICAGLEILGVRLDPALNTQANSGIRRVSAANSTVEVLVVPTDEELEIARLTATKITG